MKCFTFELDGKEINMRLTSQDSIKIENASKVSLFEYIEKLNITSTINLLKFMRRGGGEKSFSDQDAYDFYDKLVDEDYTVEKIVKEIIMPTCQVSGLFTKDDLQKIQEAEVSAKATED